jgi:uncharacterized membrane protein YhhN
VNQMRRTTLTSFILCALAYVLTIPYSPYPGSLLVKALPVFILLGVAWVSLQGPARLFMVAALFFSAGGDIFLELDKFTPGLASFLIAQLCYAWYFFSQRTTGALPYARLIIIMAIMLSVSFPVISHAGEIFIPVAVYMSAITAMGIAAALYRAPSTLVFVGALLFVVSDSMIGINRFVTPLPGSRYAIMLAYYGAQLLMLWGVMHAVKHQRQMAPSA